VVEAAAEEEEAVAGAVEDAEDKMERTLNEGN